MSFVIVPPSGTKIIYDRNPTWLDLATVLDGTPTPVLTEYTIAGLELDDALERGYQPNPVAGAMLALLGAPWAPYAGPIAFARWTDTGQVASLQTDDYGATLNLHQDVAWALNIAGYPLPSRPERLVPVAEIERVASYIRAGVR